MLTSVFQLEPLLKESVICVVPGRSSSSNERYHEFTKSLGTINRLRIFKVDHQYIFPQIKFSSAKIKS